MSYIRKSDSTSPATKSEYFYSGSTGMVGYVSITAPQCIGNPTDTAGFISFKMPGNNSYQRDYFQPGQFKPWVVESVLGVTGTVGSTVDSYVAGS